MKTQLNTQDNDRLSTYMQMAEERSKYFIGYPIAQDFDYSELYRC